MVVIASQLGEKFFSPGWLGGSFEPLQPPGYGPGDGRTEICDGRTLSKIVNLYSTQCY